MKFSVPNLRPNHALTYYLHSDATRTGDNGFRTRKDGTMHSEHSTDARIDEEAAEWLIDLKDPESWHEDRTRPESFLNWLTRSKRHGDAFYEVACTWRKL